MNEKFGNLGTALSRDEAKKIIGGEGEEEIGGAPHYSCNAWNVGTPCSWEAGWYCIYYGGRYICSHP